MYCIAYWFRELFLGLKPAASMERQESFEKTIDGQVRCITAEDRPRGGNVTVNVSYINVYIPAWTVHSSIMDCYKQTLSQKNKHEHKRIGYAQCCTAHMRLRKHTLNINIYQPSHTRSHITHRRGENNIHHLKLKQKH